MSETEKIFIETLEMCLAAMYEAHGYADVFKMPPNLGNAIQQTQYVLETYGEKK